MGRELILMVEDDQDLLEVLGNLLKITGYDVFKLDSSFGVASLVRKLQPSLVVIDVSLPFRPGTALLSQLKDSMISPSPHLTSTRSTHRS